MAQLDWTIARALLYRVTFLLAVVAWLAVFVMAHKQAHGVGPEGSFAPCPPVGDGTAPVSGC